MVEDERLPRKITHEIGQDLSTLSIEELSERMHMLSEEIARLEQARTKKQSQRSLADSIFKLS